MIGVIFNRALIVIGLAAVVVPVALDQLNVADFDMRTLAASACVGLAAIWAAIESPMKRK